MDPDGVNTHFGGGAGMARPPKVPPGLNPRQIASQFHDQLKSQQVKVDQLKQRLGNETRRAHQTGNVFTTTGRGVRSDLVACLPLSSSASPLRHHHYDRTLLTEKLAKEKAQAIEEINLKKIGLCKASIVVVEINMHSVVVPSNQEARRLRHTLPFQLSIPVTVPDTYHVFTLQRLAEAENNRKRLKDTR